MWAAEVKVWLKNLRLHKYCNLFMHMNYEEMVGLTEAELERLGSVKLLAGSAVLRFAGVTAKGARGKIAKELEMLKQTNLALEETIRHLIAVLHWP